MEERRLGPVVGLGTWSTFGGDVAAAREVVGAALAAGCHLVDTSPMYGEAERSLATALGDRRSDVIVATKIWAGRVAEGQAQYARQRDWFGAVEIEQVHNLVSWRDHLAWLEPEREAGRVTRLGVTHWSPASFSELAEALRTRRFDCVQLPYNPLESACERELLPLAAEVGVAVLVMRPFGEGSLLRRTPAAASLEPLHEFGVETWAQALLKWILSDERVDVVIPATRRAARVAENAAAGSAPWFGPREREYVAGLASA
jgi:diketogulonate reductase-like aldo/keto reductase